MELIHQLSRAEDRRKIHRAMMEAATARRIEKKRIKAERRALHAYRILTRIGMMGDKRRGGFNIGRSAERAQRILQQLLPFMNELKAKP